MEFQLSLMRLLSQCKQKHDITVDEIRSTLLRELIEDLIGATLSCYGHMRLDDLNVP